MMREGTVDAPPQDTLRDERGLTEVAFSRLLEWLDDGIGSHGETYLEMRRRLVKLGYWQATVTPEESLDPAASLMGLVFRAATRRRW